MIIPIRCFTCGKVLADKWNYYKQKSDAIDSQYEIEQLTKFDNIEGGVKNQNQDERRTIYKNMEPTYKKEVLDYLGLNKMCCRRHLISHVDMMGKI